MVGDILQPTHLLFVLIVALLVLGPKRLPEVGRSLGRGLRDFKNAISGEDSNESPLPPATSQTPAQPAEPVQPAQPVESAPPVQTPQPADVTHPSEPAATGAPTAQPSGSVDPAATAASDAGPQPVGTNPTNPAS